ncbi:MAG: Crp/Fnr family transcriptional regulator [Brumimicrobium sp.]
MKNLIKYIESQFSLTNTDISLLENSFISVNVPANTKLLEAGKIEHYVYFLSSGIVKGYQNIDGKLVIQHLVSEQDFFTSLDSFMNETPSLDYYETITDCKLVKISKPNFDNLQVNTTFWKDFVKIITNEHLSCKLERVKDFQILTAKERYLKFINQYPKLALNVSVDNIASFLGIEPQSLSRIRKQVTF